MKKLFSYVLTLLLIAAASLSAFAASAGTIEIGSAEGEQGGTAEVTITLNSDQTIGAVGLHILYDSSVLTLTEIRCEEGFADGSWDGNTDTAKLVWADTKGATPSGGKAFMTLVFTVSADAAPGTVTEIDAEYDPNGDICDLDRNPLEMTVSKGSVTVTEKETEPEETTTAEPEETTTAEPEEETTTAAPEEETTTAAPEEETTTAAPEEETTTAVPEEETTTAAPAEETTTAAPAEETTTAAPADQTDTAEETTTAAQTTTAEPVTTTAASAETTAASAETTASETTTVPATAAEETTAVPDSDTTPGTGDEAHPAFYAALLLLSGSAAVILFLKRRKEA